MKDNKENDWEAQWRKTLAGHKSTPVDEDWSGMEHLLDTQLPEPAEAFADPDTPRLPELSIRRFFKFWPQSLLGLLLIIGLGFGLGQCRADEITNEIRGEIDFFSKEADPPIDYHRSSVKVVPANDSRRALPRCAPGPGYQITTYQVFDDNGLATGRFEHDTVWMNVPTYRFDTIYFLDDLGNLTDSIYSIDSTKVAGLH